MKKYSLVILAALVVVAGSLRYLSSLARVTANVSGRELPIYLGGDGREEGGVVI